MLKYVVGLLIVIIAIVGVYLMLPARSAGTQPEIAQDGHEHGEPQRPSAWTFEEAEEKDGIPQTRVAVDVHGAFVPIGVFEGNCGDMIGSAWELAPGASEGAICWFAGGGTEIAVFHEGGMHVIKAAPIDEGTAEGGGGRGEFATLLTI